MRPEGAIHDRGVKNVHGGLGDYTLGRVINAKGDWQGEREVDLLVGGAFLEVEGGSICDVGCNEGGARAVAMHYFGRGGVDKADEHAGNFDGDIFHMKEPGVIAAVLDEILVFDAGVEVSEGTALWLQDGADALVRHDDVEPCKEVVVCQSNGMLHGGMGLLEAGVKYCSVVIACLVEMMRAVGEATRVGAEVRPDVAEPVK